MNENKNENLDSLNEDLEEVVVPGDDADDDAKAEYVTKLEKQNKQLFERTKKAEGFEKDKDGKWIKKTIVVDDKKKEPESKKDTSGEQAISPTDMFILMKSGVEAEDIADIADYASFRKISIGEALQSEVMKTILAEKAEKRKVAEGTHTGDAPRSSGKISDEKLMSDAKKGIMPEKDEDMDRLIELRRANK